jgi:hypothetical protein
LESSNNLISQINQDSSFLKVPGEFRNRIYTYHFTSAIYVITLEEMNGKGLWGHSDLPQPKIRIVPTHLPLLQASQIRYETSALPFVRGTLKLKNLSTLLNLNGYFILEERSGVTSLYLEMRCDNVSNWHCLESHHRKLPSFARFYLG